MDNAHVEAAEGAAVHVGAGEVRRQAGRARGTEAGIGVVAHGFPQSRQRGALGQGVVRTDRAAVGVLTCTRLVADAAVQGTHTQLRGHVVVGGDLEHVKVAVTLALVQVTAPPTLPSTWAALLPL